MTNIIIVLLYTQIQPQFKKANKMTEEDKKITVLLFRNLAAQVYVSGNKEEYAEEVEDDRNSGLLSRLQGYFQKSRLKDELSELDAVISANLRRASDLAEILTENSVNTERKRKARQHIEDALEISGIVLNDEYQSILVLTDIDYRTISQLAGAIETLPHNSKLLIVLDKDNLQTLAQKLMQHENIKLNLEFGEGVRIILGDNREISKIR